MNNVSRLFQENALLHPQRLALQVPEIYGDSHFLTYEGMLLKAIKFQQQLVHAGLQEGDRLLIIIKPGWLLYSFLIAMLGLGLVPVMPERGLSKKQFRTLIRHSFPSGVVTEPETGKWWFAIPELWKMERFVLDGRIPGMKSWLSDSGDTSANSFICRDLPVNARGIITFTSGTTGLPKGANRTHQSLLAQFYAIEEHLSSQGKGTDLHSFPVMSLHSLCRGNSVILPDFDFAHPAGVKAEKIIKQLQENRISTLSGAFAYLYRIVKYCLDQSLQFPHVKYVLVGGAPINRALCEACITVFPQAAHWVIYGSTEAEPISAVTMEELLRDWDVNEGYLAGKPVKQAEICIRRAGDEPQQVYSVATGEIGEILVAGPHVLSEYVDNPQATRENKIPRKQGKVWHCTGDVGFIDDKRRIWLLGRVKDQIHLSDGRVINPFVVEKKVNELLGGNLSAFIPHPQGNAALILQYSFVKEEIRSFINSLNLSYFIRFYLCQEIPMDVRHNSKVNRIALWKLLKKNRLICCSVREKK